MLKASQIKSQFHIFISEFFLVSHVVILSRNWYLLPVSQIAKKLIPQRLQRRAHKRQVVSPARTIYSRQYRIQSALRSLTQSWIFTGHDRLREIAKNDYVLIDLYIRGSLSPTGCHIRRVGVPVSTKRSTYDDSLHY